MTNRIEVVDNDDGTMTLTFDFEGEEHKSLITMDFKVLMGVFSMLAEDNGTISFDEATGAFDAEVIPIPDNIENVD